jgi:nicotinamide phosphoribosyltransferase
MMEYYNSNICGFSIPAAEHSTITSWGKDGEINAFKNMIDKYQEGV